MWIFHGIYLRSYSDLKRGSSYHTLTGKLWDAYLVYSIHYIQASKFQIECTCPLGKWIVKITCPNVPFNCLKYIKPMQLMWKSEICSCPSDKSCRYSTCPTVIFTRLRRAAEWNFEPCIGFWTYNKIPYHTLTGKPWSAYFVYCEENQLCHNGSKQSVAWQY